MCFYPGLNFPLSSLVRVASPVYPIIKARDLAGKAQTGMGQ